MNEPSPCHKNQLAHLAVLPTPEEEAVGKTKAVPFLLEDKLKEQGALYEKQADWASFSVVDGKLVTGQNPGSAPETAKKALEAAGLAK